MLVLLVAGLLILELDSKINEVLEKTVVNLIEGGHAPIARHERELPKHCTEFTHNKFM